MRTTLDINEELLEKAMELSDAKTKKEIINLSLREFVRHNKLVRLAKRYGKSPLGMTLRKLYYLRSAR